MRSPGPAPDAAISEAALEALIGRFYARARADSLLGPMFAAAIDGWEPHLAAITDFWGRLKERDTDGAKPDRA